MDCVLERSEHGFPVRQHVRWRRVLRVRGRCLELFKTDGNPVLPVHVPVMDGRDTWNQPINI